MKRSSEYTDGERQNIKRSNSSLFSIATLVDNVDIGGSRMGNYSGGTNSPKGLSLEADDNDNGDDNNNLDGETNGISTKTSFIPLHEDNDIDENMPESGISSSCSSSEAEEKDNEDCNDIGKCNTLVEIPSPTKKESSDTTRVRKETHIQTNDNRTGILFESGSEHFDRYNRLHKERPIRITAVHDYLTKAKSINDVDKTIYERCVLLESLSNESKCTHVTESKKTPEELWLDDFDYLRVHLPGYMQRLDRISKCNCHNRLDIEAEQFKSIYFTNDSVYEAKAAASSLCKLVSRVTTGDLDNGFAIIRPPGHHAEPGLAGGYCVINNVAVAAAYAQAKLGIKKVLIVDWDVHLGNGTQKCCIDNPNILYFSAHRYHGGNFFPFHQCGGPTNVGVGDGEGFNINVGWNEKNIDDDSYLVLWEKLLMPVASEFDPDLILVSAGFDAAKGDMGECFVTPECFARLTRRLKTLASGKVVCALEGGYVRSVLCKCIESVLEALLDASSNDKCKAELDTFYSKLGENEMLDCIDASPSKSIQDTIKAHTKYWKCLQM